jgi:hypothetical protein
MSFQGIASPDLIKLFFKNFFILTILTEQLLLEKLYCLQIQLVFSFISEDILVMAVSLVCSFRVWEKA